MSDRTIQKKMANVLSANCEKVTKQDLLDHAEGIREVINDLPDNDDPIVLCCDKEENVQSMMQTVCASLCATEQAVAQLQCMVDESDQEAE